MSGSPDDTRDEQIRATTAAGGPSDGGPADPDLDGGPADSGPAGGGGQVRLDKGGAFSAVVLLN